MKKLITIVCIVFCTSVIFVLIGCGGYKGYKGDNPELYSVAINSLVGSNGFNTHNGEAFYDPTITILEEDDYGRTLFYYFEDNKISTHSLLVCQKSEGGYAFYYQDYNFISASANNFSDNKIAELKEKNDWNNEIEESKCTRVEITSKRAKLKVNKSMKKIFDVLCQKIATENGCKGQEPTVFRSATYCTSDKYGRTLYYVYGIHRDVKGEGISPSSQTMHLDLVVILNSDNTYDEETCVMELSDKYNYQEDLKLFKELNNWNLSL